MKVNYGRPQTIEYPKERTAVSVLPGIFLLFLAGAVLGKYAIYNTCFAVQLAHTFTTADSIRRVLQYPLLIIGAMFFPVGLLLVPMLVFIRGFTISCAAITLWSAADSSMTVRLCIVPMLIQLPALYLLSTFAWKTAVGRMKRDPHVGSNAHRNQFLLIVLYCIVAAFLNVIWEGYILPQS